MNSTKLRLFLLYLGIFIVAPTVLAFDASSELSVIERYTLQENGHVFYESGKFRAGRLLVLVRYETPDFWTDDDLYTLSIVSGRTIIPEPLFFGLKQAGVIPTWIRSRDTYRLAFSDYVIVAVRGHEDPNPIPVITQQPRSVRVLVGNSALFVVGDNLPFWIVDYQWRKNGIPIPGETSFLFAVNDVTPRDAGNYAVWLSTGGRPVKSQAAHLTVVLPVTIFSQPKPQTLRVGQSASFRVGAKGTGSFTYQWYFNGAEIPGATKSFLTIRNAQTASAGTYSVNVSNGLSDQQSSDAILTFTP